MKKIEISYENGITKTLFVLDFKCEGNFIIFNLLKGRQVIIPGHQFYKIKVSLETDEFEGLGPD